MTVLLELENISRRYALGEGEVTVLQDVSLTVHAGEMVAIIGASGSGKSTLMNIIGCLDTPSSGTYRVAGADVATLDGEALARLRREHFGFIFQRYHLMAHLSAQQNVEIPAIYAGTPAKVRRQRARELLERLGLGPQLAHRPAQLSGGQQQRVSIARALINGGQVILADEPTGALDSRSGKEVMAILQQLCASGHTVILVTHDPAIAAQADRILEISDGKIISNPPPIRSAAAPAARAGAPVVAPQAAWRRALSGFRESLAMAWVAMTSNKLRTLLTMLGIIIGITSVISITLVGDAAKNMVLKDIRAIGTNTIDVYPGKELGDDDPQYKQVLKHDDLAAIRKQPWARSATPEISQNVRLFSHSKNFSVTANGVSDQYFNVYGITAIEGTTFNPQQIAQRSPVVVISAEARRQLFPWHARAVGEVILVGNMPATVIGVAEPKESMQSGKQALRAWLPYTTMAERVTGQSWLNSITVRVNENWDSAEAEKQLNQLLTLRHNQKDFFTWNVDTILKTAEKVTRTLQLFLTLVAVISLVVGGIGVMNIMLVSVTERTREIGIRRAVGARESDVLAQFLIESVLVCLAGGAIGVLLSLTIALLLRLLAPGWEISFSAAALLAAFCCSTLIGVMFGYLPARRAARLKPVDALVRE